MKKMLLFGFVIVFLVGGVFVGGASSVRAESDTPYGRELTVCEGVPDNYFELESFGTDRIVVPDAGEIIRSVKGIQLPLSFFFESRGERLIHFVPVCAPAEFFSMRLEKIWTIERRADSKEPIVVDMNDSQVALKRGIRIPSGDRAESGGRVSLGDRMVFVSDVSPTPLAPDVRGLKKGIFRFDYEIMAAGKNSRGILETEVRKVNVYLISSDIPLEERLRLSGKDLEGYKNDTAFTIDNIIEGKQVFSFSPSEARVFEFSLELEKTDGSRQRSCPEDVNKDGVINIIDLVVIARSFGQTVPVDSGYAEDVNNDGKVNIIDLVTVARRFGQRCQDAAYVSPLGERVVFVPVPVARQSQSTGLASVLKSIFWVIGE